VGREGRDAYEAVNGAGHAVLSYCRSIDNASDTEIRFVKEA